MTLSTRLLSRATLATAEEALVAAALAVRQQAYAPYSQFLVGAALRTCEGAVVVGCNVENVSFGLTNCAERTAVFTAIAGGARQFALLALASAGGVTPCGACRQVLAEFAPALRILLIDSAQPDQVRECFLGDLLPGSFAASALPPTPVRPA